MLGPESTLYLYPFLLLKEGHNLCPYINTLSEPSLNSMTVTSRRLTREQIHVMPINMSPHRKLFLAVKPSDIRLQTVGQSRLFYRGTSRDTHQSSLAALHPLRDEISCVHHEALTHHWLVWSSSSPRWAQAGQNGVRLPEWSQDYKVFSCSVMSDAATPWTAAPQASLFITNSPSLLKLISIELVMPSNHLILSSVVPFSSCL